MNLTLTLILTVCHHVIFLKKMFFQVFACQKKKKNHSNSADFRLMTLTSIIFPTVSLLMATHRLLKTEDQTEIAFLFTQLYEGNELPGFFFNLLI